ncbi:MAG: TonB-dependent receptor [Cyclobacteriaceae bacterium]|jgi:iron complex outermembrane receptor protein|nr:TonB-dependent receptor [Cyclobacteriaceae bacterium]
MLKFSFWAALLLLTNFVHAQNVEVLVRNAQSKEPLSGATVSLLERNKVFVTNSNGIAIIDVLNNGKQTLLVRYVGYENKKVEVGLPVTSTLVVELTEGITLTDEVIIRATRAEEDAPTTFTNIGKEQIQKQNFGQDLPFLLNWSPSLVTTSDAGNGIGYTGVRIRGSDATRINVTLNGIPYNDSESQGTFWVNLPDIASSTESIQVQRGVGTSTNGGSAFGASINLQTNTLNEKPYAELLQAAGTFNTRRHTIRVGTGLMENNFTFDGRFSYLLSDGFIDRASSDLQSYYFSGGYYKNKTIVRALVFGGRERTFQSWAGVPQSRLNNDTEAMLVTAGNEGWSDAQIDNLLNADSRTFNPYLYPDQVDNYQQNHYQLHVSQSISNLLTANVSLHYTKGKGYFEEYRYKNDVTDYGLQPISIGDSLVERVDLVRRRWLDNDFYGLTFSLQYDHQQLQNITGGGWNTYSGDHFGEIIWAEVINRPTGHQYYFNVGDKKDFNIYNKTTYRFTSAFSAFLDLQYRHVGYKARGIENRQRNIAVDTDFNFFNPKAGISYFGNNYQLYASVAVANREPVRDDFVDNPGSTPKSENLINYEGGMRWQKNKLGINANVYYMDYNNQLVLTGALNDVGAPVRTNVANSYRAGIEIETNWQISEKINWQANATLSENKIRNFEEVVYDYGEDFSFAIPSEIRNTYKNTEISFSPSIIAGSVLSYQFAKGAEVAWLSKYVSEQFLDNTRNNNRKIDAFFVNDLRISYSIQPKFVSGIDFSLLVNNVFNEEYESNGYTYGFLAGSATFRENFFYPQAGTHFLAMVTIKL